MHKTKYWIEKCFTIRKDFLFPVGAICRVVDIVHFHEDKDALEIEELRNIQNNYIDLLLESKTRVNYLQYAKGIVQKKNDNCLLLNKTNGVVIQANILNKNEAKAKLEECLGVPIIKNEFLKSCIDMETGAINYYYRLICDSDIVEILPNTEWIEKQNASAFLKGVIEDDLLEYSE